MLLSSVKSCLRDMYSDFVAPEGLKSKMIQNSTSKNSLNMSKIENGNTNKEIANAFRLEVERIKLENELEKKEMEWNFETMNREYQRELDYKTKKVSFFLYLFFNLDRMRQSLLLHFIFQDPI